MSASQIWGGRREASIHLLVLRPICGTHPSGILLIDTVKLRKYTALQKLSLTGRQLGHCQTTGRQRGDNPVTFILIISVLVIFAGILYVARQENRLRKRS